VTVTVIFRVSFRIGVSFRVRASFTVRIRVRLKPALFGKFHRE